jgi:hypothetical protein
VDTFARQFNPASGELHVFLAFHAQGGRISKMKGADVDERLVLQAFH